jgi:hypothetical protein
MSNTEDRFYGIASEEIERKVKEHIPYKDLTPEQFINSDSMVRVLYSDLHLYKFRDQELDSWIQYFGELIFGLADEEFERQLKTAYPYKSMSPEEYAARFGYTCLVCGVHFYRYRDKELQEWLNRFARVLVTEGLVEHYRKLLLTPEEYEEVKKCEEEFEP